MEDYVYTMCYEAAFMHRLRLRLGLPGFPESAQIASVEFWSRMTKLFRNAGTGETVTGFPDTSRESTRSWIGTRIVSFRRTSTASR